MTTARIYALLLAWKLALTSVFALPLIRREDVEGNVSFQYQGNTGPNLWPEFCQDINPGQSPIDIRPGSADPNSGALQATLQPLTGVKLQNSGHGLEFILPEGGTGSTFVAAGQAETFQINGFHIHSPSEHRYGGNYFDAEVHFVGTSPSGKSSVMAIMFEVSEQPLANNLMSVVAQQVPLNGRSVDLPPFDFGSIMLATNNLTGFHTYVGSLTTPPCTTGVLWNVVDTPVPISINEVLAIRKEQGFTARFVQVARDERPIFNDPVLPTTGTGSVAMSPLTKEVPAGVPPMGGLEMVESIESLESLNQTEGAPDGGVTKAQSPMETDNAGLAEPASAAASPAEAAPIATAFIPGQTAVFPSLPEESAAALPAPVEIAAPAPLPSETVGIDPIPGEATPAAVDATSADRASTGVVSADTAPTPGTPAEIPLSESVSGETVQRVAEVVSDPLNHGSDGHGSGGGDH